MEEKFFFLHCAQNQAVRSAAHNIAIIKNVLTGEGAFVATNNQIAFKIQV